MTTTASDSSADVSEIVTLLANIQYQLYQMYQLEEQLVGSGASVSADPPPGATDPTGALGATGPQGATGAPGAIGPTEETSGSSTEGSVVAMQNSSGSHTISINAPHQAVSSMHDDVFVVASNAFGQNTFVFTPGFGHDEITGALGPRHHLGFQVSGATHDTLELSGADFRNSIVDVLRHTFNVQGGVEIFDPVTADTIKIDGVSRFALAHNKQDFKFV